MNNRVRTVVKSPQGKTAIQPALQETIGNDGASRPVLASVMLVRAAIVIFVCAFVAAHAWGIYRIETTLRALQSVRQAPIVLGE